MDKYLKYAENNGLTIKREYDCIYIKYEGDTVCFIQYSEHEDYNSEYVRYDTHPTFCIQKMINELERDTPFKYVLYIYHKLKNNGIKLYCRSIPELGDESLLDDLPDDYITSMWETGYESRAIKPLMITAEDIDIENIGYNVSLVYDEEMHENVRSDYVICVSIEEGLVPKDELYERFPNLKYIHVYSHDYTKYTHHKIRSYLRSDSNSDDDSESSEESSEVYYVSDNDEYSDVYELMKKEYK